MLSSILLVEDDNHKRNSIIQFMEEVFPNTHTRVAASLMSGIKSVRQFIPDAILLDMTLPNFDTKDGETGGGMHAFGGVEFLKQLKRRKLNVPTIVITQFETFGQPPNLKDLPELDAELHEAFSPAYLGAVYYHASISDWTNALKTLLDKVD